MLCATTGIAAVNLGDAVTINSQLGFFNTESLQEGYTQGWIQQRLRRLRAAGITRILLDEVSMLEAQALTILLRAFEELNTEVSVALGHEQPIGLTLIGDFLQLPPVKGDFAFQSPEWHHFGDHTERLTEIRRQGDKDFIEALRAARVGNGEAVAAYLAPHLLRSQDLGFSGTVIVAKNKVVDRINGLRHSALPGTPVDFPSRRWTKDGRKEPADWQHIPQTLKLKPGALVMVLANQYDGDQGFRELVCANGDLGTFLGKDQANNPVVELRRTKQEVHVKWVTRQILKPTGAKGKKKDAYTIEGEITYAPLRLAYASTVHKTQGLTLDNVMVDISDGFFASPGMLYVALSRARSVDGLKVVGTPQQVIQRCNVDPRVHEWI